jgi:hypothetical protein
MALTYEEAGTLAFGDSEFTTSEFGRRLGVSGGAKILSELKRRGRVSRTGRGRYRFLTPAERPDLRSMEWERVRTIILDGPEPKAWTGSTAVEVWTRGGYSVSPSPFSRVFSLAVPKGSLAVWRRYLGGKGLSDKPRKRIGAKVSLVAVARLRSTRVGGESVIPRSEVVALIRRAPSVFAGAEELLID